MKNLFNAAVLVGFLVGDICLLGALVCGVIAGFVLLYSLPIASEPFLAKVFTLGVQLLASCFLIWGGGILLERNLNWLVNYFKEIFKENTIKTAIVPA